MENYRKVKPFNWLLFIGVLLVGANLRAPITSIGVALPDIKMIWRCLTVQLV